MDARLQALYGQMVEFFSGDPRRIQHWVKVHSFARMIGLAEGLDPHALFVLEAAAMVHDCGIRPGEAKYGADHAHGHVQEVEGPPVARPMLEALGFEAGDTERILFLIAHHHTYSAVDGLDFQCLIEADCLVNLYEGSMYRAGRPSTLPSLFKTACGRRFACAMFGYSLD